MAHGIEMSNHIPNVINQKNNHQQLMKKIEINKNKNKKIFFNVITRKFFDIINKNKNYTFSILTSPPLCTNSLIFP